MKNHSRARRDKSADLLLDLANFPESNAPDFRRSVEALARGYREIFKDITRIRLFGNEARGQTGFQRAVIGLRQHIRAAWEAPDDRQRDWYIFQLRALYKTHTDAAHQQQEAQHWKEHRGELLEAMSAEERSWIEARPTDARLARKRAPAVGMNLWDVVRRARFWGYGVEPPPPLTLFEAVMFHFQRIGHRARKCANAECHQSPYFFATRKGQNYCSNECSAPAKAAAKLRYWHRTGSKRRKERAGTPTGVPRKKRRNHGPKK
jgi:hypothetical protein